MSFETSVLKNNNSPCKLVTTVNVQSVKTTMTKNSNSEKLLIQNNNEHIKIVSFIFIKISVLHNYIKLFISIMRKIMLKILGVK